MDILEWLRAPVLVVAGAPITVAELIGDATGIACVWLVARQHIASWPIGLLNNVMWGVLFADARLYADASLQAIFFALGIYGWVIWARGGARREPLRVRRTTQREWAALAVATALATAVIAGALARLTDSPAPLADASVLTLSLAATYGQAHKLLESWWLWIAVDVISVPLYVSRALYPTAAVYVGFTVLCVIGLSRWRRECIATAS